MSTKFSPILLLIAMLIPQLSGCASRAAGHAGEGFQFRESDYARLGLDPNRIQPWEDGMRTTGGKGSYEWWYFDAALEDGSTIVIVFYTKSMIQVDSGLEPMVSFKQTDPRGATVFEKTIKVKASSFSASRQGCDVRVGANSVSGDLKDYAIHLDDGNLKADLRLSGTVPSYRPGTGFAYFEPASGTERYFAWLPAVPQGVMEGSLKINGAESRVRGSGYHDHNWGDASLLGLVHDWYWGRAQVGDYTVITAYMTASDAYGGTTSPVFFLSRGGENLISDPSKTVCALDDISWDPKTGKPVANTLTFTAGGGTEGYRVSYHRQRDIERAKLADQGGPLASLAAALAGFDGAYLRFGGEATVERLEDGKVVEAASDASAVWELMYFGHAPKR